MPYDPPLDWEAMLGFLRARAIEAVEHCDGLRYRRALPAPGGYGIVTITVDQSHHAVRVDCPSAARPGLDAVGARVRAMLDLDADIGAIESALSAARLPPRLTVEMPGVRVPGAWDAFELGVRAILGQQITVKAARTLAGRLCQRFGRRLSAAGVADGAPTRLFPTPSALAEADVGVIGVPRRKAQTVRTFARAVCEHALEVERPANLDAAAARLLAVPGIGRWTVGYIRMRAFNDPDAFPPGDVALVKAARLLGIASDATSLERVSERWRPWRAYVAARLWRSLTGA